MDVKGNFYKDKILIGGIDKINSGDGIGRRKLPRGK
jgi:hypothetical protein